MSKEQNLEEKATTLDKLEKTKKSGFLKNLVLIPVFMSLTISIGLTIGNSSTANFLPSFIASFIVILIISIGNWLDLDSKIISLKEELSGETKSKRKNNSNKKKAWFIVALLFSLLFMYKKITQSWEYEFNELYNEKNVVRFKNKFSLLPVEVVFTNSEGTKIKFRIPKGYLFISNDNSNNIQVSSQLPDLDPWKLTNEKLQKIKELNHQNHEKYKLWKGPLLSRLLAIDPNYVGIDIFNHMPLNEMLVQETYAKSIEPNTLSKFLIPSEAKLYDYNGSIKLLGSELSKFGFAGYSGKLANAKIHFMPPLAKPINEDKYPEMLFACSYSCMLFTNYNDQFGLKVSFHPSKLNQWEDIWLKVNEIMNSMIIPDTKPLINKK